MFKKAAEKPVNQKSKILKIFAPFSLVIGAALTAVVILINPFNVRAIIKNNYPDFPF